MDDRLPDDSNTEVTSIESLPSERQDRLRSLVELQRRGMSNAMIAKILRVGEATVYRDKQILKSLAVSRAANIDIKEEIGDAINFLDEIADKAMEGYRSSIEDNEQIVYEVTKSGEKKAVTKSVPDHSQAQRYLTTAASAKKQKVDTILQISTTHALNKVLLSKANETKGIDVSKLRTEEDFIKAEEEIKKTNYDLALKLHRLRGPSRLDYADAPEQYHIDMAEHMRRFDEFMKIKEEFEKPWPSRKNRKHIDQAR
ncbi:MAG: hypothetical protein AB7H97_11320 [Pseudobdellovibrionaceae bacterium]